jgi:HEAT repeat protein
MRRASLLPVLACALLGVLGRDAAVAGEDLAKMRLEFEALTGGRDEKAYDAQRAVLERIADLRTAEARRELALLLERHGRADRRRAILVLSAIARRGGPEDVDEAIAWVERTRDPLLTELLDRVVAAALEPATREHLRSTALRRATPPIKGLLARGLGATGDRANTVPLLLLLKEPDVRVRVEALGALGALEDDRALSSMTVFLHDGDARIREATARALGALGCPRAGPFLLKALDDESALVAESAALSLARLEDASAIGPLIERLGRTIDTDLRLADAMIRALHAITGKAFDTNVSEWRAWWAVAGTRPWVKPSADPGGVTVAGARYYGFPVRSSRVVFVLDVSRSMGWNERLEVAQDELVQVLEQLPRTTSFNVLSFSDEVEPWMEGLVAAIPAHVRRAIAFVKARRPLNGTGTYDALLRTLRDPDVDTIFFLSDGFPTVGAVVDGELILAEVREWNRYRRVRIHAVALVQGEPPAAFAGTEDHDRAVDFMRRLASDNDGLFKEIR